MKIFFTASQRGKKEFNTCYQKIYHYLEELSFTHLDNGLVKSPSVESFYTELKQKVKKRLYEFYHNNIKNIKNADIVLFECSFPSLSIGFMTGKALEMNKPVVIFYLKGHDPYFLEGMREEKLVLVEYTKKNLKYILKETIQQVKPLIDTRFNFFINPKLLTYLQNASKEENITKSAFLRKLLFNHMRMHHQEQKLTNTNA